MMSDWSYLIAALFLPLFPLSMVFNAVFARVRQPMLRGALLLVWPQIGLFWLYDASAQPPTWLAIWALGTAGLYAFRALALREVGLWIAFMATSAWALLWIPALSGMDASSVQYDALGFSLPLVLLAFLAAGLEHRFGAAYTDLYGGLAQTVPRFSAVLVCVVLAVIATPLFPGFFTLLTTVVAVQPSTAFGLTLVWLLWSWAGARLLQGLIVGPAHEVSSPDMSLALTWVYSTVLVGLIIGGVYLTGDLL